MPTNISFALEYSLGHITHAQNLKSALNGNSDISPTYFDIPFDNTPLPRPWSTIRPIRSNWTARASLVAYLAIKSTMKSADAAFFHTQITSIFSAGLMRRLPSIISLDATPLQYDALGSFYNHAPGSGAMEQIKKKLNVRAFGAAKGLVAWSEWAKRSLIQDYGISPNKVTVIPPGIDLEKWSFSEGKVSRSEVRFLFVGGDFARKGGELLLNAYRKVVAAYPSAGLDIVTKTTDIADLPKSVIVHHGLTANSSALMALYRNADVFAFPTRGDCLPLAVMEAMAAGLPVISTNVGALCEAVVDGVTGLVVNVDDSDGMANAMMKLAEDHGRRTEMGRFGRERAKSAFNAGTNYRRLVETIMSVRGT